MAYYEMEPFGPERAEAPIAQLTAVVANFGLAPGKKPFTMEDFMPKFRNAVAATAKSMLETARLWTAALGGKDTSKKGK
jgi:hypothetical protein